MKFRNLLSVGMLCWILCLPLALFAQDSDSDDGTDAPPQRSDRDRRGDNGGENSRGGDRGRDRGGRGSEGGGGGGGGPGGGFGGRGGFGGGRGGFGGGGFGGGPGGFGGGPGGGFGGPPGGFGGGDFGRGGMGGRRDGGSGNNPTQKSRVRVGRVGPKANLPPTTLPSQYASRDLNRDGQIGMYEWSKTDLSAFRKLDTNGDGFLTPAELANPGKGGGGGGGSTTVANTTSGSSGGQDRGGDRRGSSSTSAPPAGPPADPKTEAANGVFDIVDTNKDGELSEEEWTRSRYARKLFEEKKVEVKFPFSKQKFAEAYGKIVP